MDYLRTRKKIVAFLLLKDPQGEWEKLESSAFQF